MNATWVRIGWVATVIYGVTPLFGADEPTPDAKPVSLSAIADTLQTYFESLDSIEVEYRQTPLEGDPDQEATDWRWMISGPRQLLSLNSQPGGAGLRIPHSWWSFDGEAAYFVMVNMEQPDQIQQIYQSETIDPMVAELPHPLNFLGQPLLRSETRLADALRHGTVVGTEAVGDAECIRIELPTIKSSGKERSVTVWLDPRVRYLPRRIFQREPSLTEIPKSVADQIYFVWECDEFMTIKDELTDEDRPFPQSGRMSGNNGVHRYDFLTVRINHQPPRSRFIPQAQVGTEMHVRRAGKPTVTTVFGGRAGVAKRQAEIDQQIEEIQKERAAAGQQAAENKSVADATPPTTKNIWLLGAGLFALLLVGTLWWRASRS
jgi:hypothetical protein